MLIEFFLKLKQGGLPVSVREFLTLLEALAKRVISGGIDDFYYGRTIGGARRNASRHWTSCTSIRMTTR